MFTLRKLKLHKGKTSMVGVTGGERTYPFLGLIDWEEPDYSEKLDSIQDIKVGKQVIISNHGGINFLRTSKISEIVSREPRRVVFKTQTSTYELIDERVEKPKEPTIEESTVLQRIERIHLIGAVRDAWTIAEALTIKEEETRQKEEIFIDILQTKGYGIREINLEETQE